MHKADPVWRRRRTLEAAWALGCWRLAVAVLPLRTWIGRVGTVVTGHDGDGPASDGNSTDCARARVLARHVERAAQRLPFTTLCLPRALALGAMLRRRGIAYTITIAARPPHMRGNGDDLHGWISVQETIVLGALPGPWNPVLKIHNSG